MKNRLKPVQLFLTLGLAATVAACGGAPAEDTDAPEGEGTEQTDDGGEGGEGGEGE